jgi:hypothetical protein
VIVGLDLFQLEKMYIDFDKQDFDKAIQLLKAEIQRNQREKGEHIQSHQQKE